MTDTTPSAFNTTTTLNEIRENSPCRDGWEKLLAHLGKTKADDETLELLTVLNSNGFDDALWCLQMPSLERLSRHFQAWCAEQVLHHFERERPDDMHIRDQIAMLRNDTAAARAAAWAAAWDAARAAAWDAARAAARAAAQLPHGLPHSCRTGCRTGCRMGCRTGCRTGCTRKATARHDRG